MMTEFLVRQMLYPAAPVRVPSPPEPLTEVHLAFDSGPEVVAWELPTQGGLSAS